jgi:hypothetical protein
MFYEIVESVSVHRLDLKCHLMLRGQPVRVEFALAQTFICCQLSAASLTHEHLPKLLIRPVSYVSTNQPDAAFASDTKCRNRMIYKSNILILFVRSA